jgi:hypothetical protein
MLHDVQAFVCIRQESWRMPFILRLRSRCVLQDGGVQWLMNGLGSLNVG